MTKPIICTLQTVVLPKLSIHFEPIFVQALVGFNKQRCPIAELANITVRESSPAYSAGGQGLPEDPPFRRRGIAALISARLLKCAGGCRGGVHPRPRGVSKGLTGLPHSLSWSSEHLSFIAAIKNMRPVAQKCGAPTPRGRECSKVIARTKLRPSLLAPDNPPRY